MSALVNRLVLHYATTEHAYVVIMNAGLESITTARVNTSLADIGVNVVLLERDLG